MTSENAAERPPQGYTATSENANGVPDIVFSAPEQAPPVHGATPAAAAVPDPFRAPPR